MRKLLNSIFASTCFVVPLLWDNSAIEKGPSSCLRSPTLLELVFAGHIGDHRPPDASNYIHIKKPRLPKQLRNKWFNMISPGLDISSASNRVMTASSGLLLEDSHNFLSRDDPYTCLLYNGCHKCDWSQFLDAFGKPNKGNTGELERSLGWNGPFHRGKP
ncbi:uncharacterized protein K460DRAFT_351949 [Cucurbitaria berberidis CBS 394.84]|uniref:Uncharacterized protein n=1 Tax=Cucurbitaria berberidis CBS 394.84 TaxID=1168544 RepID=A0A9P4LEJ7_9PLEO|nr:uncharacterized protein K460DRAFT_351949 [Cucurbitaria berberidis CBS 394.84]KAF1852110.1 hypothetical protein K460DRAFT_351949 [Cucurbitaria berberidis CBS 394.84]